MKVYSILDRKVRTFGQLIVAANDDSMKRTALDVLSGSGSLLEKYPGDFDLFVVGEFNDENGALLGTPPQLLCNLAEILGKES